MNRETGFSDSLKVLILAIPDPGSGFHLCVIWRFNANFAFQ